MAFLFNVDNLWLTAHGKSHKNPCVRLIRALILKFLTGRIVTSAAWRAARGCRSQPVQTVSGAGLVFSTSAHRRTTAVNRDPTLLFLSPTWAWYRTPVDGEEPNSCCSWTSWSRAHQVGGGTNRLVREITFIGVSHRKGASLLWPRGRTVFVEVCLVMVTLTVQTGSRTV